MTAILSAIKPTRRPGELGVHSVDRFHFAVPDLAIAKNFYGEFGLEIDEDGGLLAMKTPGNPHVWVTLGEGPRKKLGHISFGAFDDDFDRFAERLQAFGVKRLDPPPGVETNGLWFHDHDGNLVEIKVAAKSSPNEKSNFAELPSGPGVRGAPFRREVARVTPRRLAHVLLFTRDVEKAVQFYTRTLGLRLSDRSGDGIAFLHGIHGSDHHMIAFVKSSAPGLHHLSWDVGSVDDIGRGAMHMLDKGFARGWGLGRHVLGSNFFHYVGDPWGSFSEYSAGIDFVPADCDWKSGDHAPGGFVLRVGSEPAGLFHPQCRGVNFSPLPRGEGRGEGPGAQTLIRRFAPPSPGGEGIARLATRGMSRSLTIIEERLTMKPVYPGRLLRREMQARRLSANALALALRVSSGRITDILNGKRGVSPETAMRLARYFGNSARFWLNLQTTYELEVAEAELGERIAAEVAPAVT